MMRATCTDRCSDCSKYDCGVDPCACPDHQKPANQGRGFDALVAYEAAKLERSEAYWAGHSDEGETVMSESNQREAIDLRPYQADLALTLLEADRAAGLDGSWHAIAVRLIGSRVMGQILMAAVEQDRAANRAFRHMAQTTSERIAQAIEAAEVPEYGVYARTDGHRNGLRHAADIARAEGSFGRPPAADLPTCSHPRGCCRKHIEEAERRGRADAWDEGYLRGALDNESDLEPADNPYRETSR